MDLESVNKHYNYKTIRDTHLPAHPSWLIPQNPVSHVVQSDATFTLAEQLSQLKPTVPSRQFKHSPEIWHK